MCEGNEVETEWDFDIDIDIPAEVVGRASKLFGMFKPVAKPIKAAVHMHGSFKGDAGKLIDKYVETYPKIMQAVSQACNPDMNKESE